LLFILIASYIAFGGHTFPRNNRVVILFSSFKQLVRLSRQGSKLGLIVDVV